MGTVDNSVDNPMGKNVDLEFGEKITLRSKIFQILIHREIVIKTKVYHVKCVITEPTTTTGIYINK